MDSEGFVAVQALWVRLGGSAVRATASYACTEKAVGRGFKSRPGLFSMLRLKTRSAEDLEKTKEILCSAGYHKRLQSSSKPYVKRSEFRKWVSKKPLRTIAKVISRLAVLAEAKVYLLWEQPDENRSMVTG